MLQSHRDRNTAQHSTAQEGKKTHACSLLISDKDVIRRYSGEKTASSGNGATELAIQIRVTLDPVSPFFLKVN